MADREKGEKVIKAVEYLNWYFTQDDGTADKNAVKAWEVLLREQEPEIVRCKDCKHHRENICEVLIGIYAPDWFCADGERR